MSKSPIRVLALFDYNSFTGFATVSKNLVKNWSRIFGESMKLDIIAVNYFGEDYSENDNIRVISAKKKDVANDDFGRYVFIRSLRDIDYDLIFILQDLGVIVPVIPFIKKILENKKTENKKQFKSILYFPVDFALTPNLVVGLEFFNTLITYTDFGKQHILNLRPDLQPKLKVIPHGNNMENFYVLPKDEIDEFRKTYFKDNAEKFIIGCVNRNQSRKDIPTTIFGFLEYWQEINKKSFLYLHMNPKDPMGWHLRSILAQTPLREGIDFAFPPEEDYNKGADVITLNRIYNSLDCFLSTATGEGWGLTITEAMACQIPIIAPNHTSISEITKNGERAYVLNTLYPVVAMVDNIIRFQSDLYEIAETIDIVKCNIEKKNPYHAEKLDKALKYVQSQDWMRISKVFAEEIKRLT